MPPFQLAKAQIDRCLRTACGSFKRKGDVDARWKIIEQYSLWWSTVYLVIISECIFFPAKWWVDICQCSFHNSQTIIFSGVRRWNGGASAKLWGFHPIISLSIWATPTKCHPLHKLVHGDSRCSMLYDATLTTVRVNSYSYNKRTICYDVLNWTIEQLTKVFGKAHLCGALLIQEACSTAAVLVLWIGWLKVALAAKPQATRCLDRNKLVFTSTFRNHLKTSTASAHLTTAHVWVELYHYHTHIHLATYFG